MRLESKHVWTARCLMSLIGLLASTKKMVPVSKANSVGCNGQLNRVAYINKQGGTHSGEMCALLWKIMTWCHHYQITLKARHIPGYLNVMADLLSRSNQVQSTEWSLHPQVFKQICQKWFTPHVDLFATRLNHKLPLYVSPVQEQNAWDIDGLNIKWSVLTAYAYPPTALLHRVIQKIRQCRLARDTLVLGPSAAFNRDPISATSVENSSQTVPQLCVSQQSTTSQPPRLLSRSGQLQGQGFSVEVAEIIAAPQRSSTRTIYKSKWALFEKRCSQSPTHSRPAECGSRQAIQARPDHSNRVVSPSRSFPSYMKQVAPASSRPVCHEVQQQVTSVCVTGSGSPSYSSGCTQSSMEGSGCVCLSTSSHLG